MQKPVYIRKSVSKLLGVWTFLLFLILKGAFAKPAIALSTLDTCAAQPACRVALGSELAPAVTAPTGAGWGASTLSTTTATGTTSTYVKAVAGVAVVTAGVLTPESTANDANIAKWHYWSQATNSRAQVLAKQRYCAAYASDYVCGIPGGQSPEVNYYAFGTFTWQQYDYQYPEVVGTTGEWCSYFTVTGPISRYEVLEQDGYSSITFYRPDGTSKRTPISWARYPGSSFIYYSRQPQKTWHYYGNNFKLLRFVRADGQPDTDGARPPLPWKDWSQEKRNLAVGLLTDSDWQSLISSMPVGGRLRPGDTVKAPRHIIPGQEEDDPNTPADERILRKGGGFFTNPGGPNTDFDNDGTPDSADSEPQNPNVPRASNDPPPPSNESAPSEGEQAVDKVRESYDDFLDNPENASYRDRLDAIEEKYRRAAAMEDAAATDPDAGYEQDRLIGEADGEFRQLENEIGEAWWTSLSQYERQLFDGRSQAEINEMQRLMEQWDQGTFTVGGVPHSVVYHANEKGYTDYLEYLRDASNFDKSQATRTPREGLREDYTVKWEIVNTGEYLIEDQNGKFLTYGFND